jgi:hypothetical protein
VSGVVGGDPEVVGSAAGPLRSVADRVGSAGPAIDRRAGDAAGSVGDPAAARALARFAVAASRAAVDTGILFDTAATLVANAATDLDRAGGQHAPGRQRRGVR